jgi:phosphoribosylglycinamide formyltransferase-1
MADALISPPLPTPLPCSPQPWRLGILASGSGTNMAAIAAAIADGRLHAEIAVVVYNNPGAGVVDKAAAYGIPTVLHNHRHYDSREALDAALVATLQAHGVEWVVMAGWMRRVTSVLIDAFPRHMLNIHPSLLPSFPGVRAVEQALKAGVAIAGCTVHFVELVVDSGPIILQAAVPVLPTDTAATLQARIQQQEHIIYPAAIAIAASSGSGTIGPDPD